MNNHAVEVPSGTVIRIPLEDMTVGDLLATADFISYFYGGDLDVYLTPYFDEEGKGMVGWELMKE